MLLAVKVLAAKSADMPTNMNMECVSTSPEDVRRPCGDIAIRRDADVSILKNCRIPV